jgi:hypothetical protein
MPVGCDWCRPPDKRRSSRAAIRCAFGLSLLIFTGATSFAQDPATGASSGQTRIHQKVHNPFSGLITLQIDNNFEFAPGPEHSLRYTMNLEPTVPFSLGRDWLVVTQMVMPIVAQQSPGVGRDSTFGLGDTQLTFFISPQNVNEDWVWGAGPVFQLPATTDDGFSTRKWGAGPSFNAVRQGRQWTLGLVLNHIWSFAGPGDDDVSTSSIDPSVVHSWDNGFSVKLETESSYDWKAGQWTVPLELGVSKLVRGKPPINLGADFLYYVERAPTDPRWGIRFSVTFVFNE